MKNVIQRYKNDLKDWWQRVQDDVAWSEYSFDGEFYTQVCFISQQIAEKAFKSYLLSQNIIVQKTHKLPSLISQAIKLDNGFDKYRKHTKILDRYYVTTRYPPNFGPKGGYSKEEAEEALKLAKEIVEFVKKKIGL